MLKRLLVAVLMALAFAAHAGVKSLPWGPKPQFVDANGAPMSSGTLQFYAAGSTTPQNTYTDSTGGTANSNPVTLNSRGETPSEVWLTEGLSYKLVLKDSGGSTVWTVDNLTGINDTSSALDEWKASQFTPTFVSATSFTVAGDQTVEFHVGRRVRTTNSGGSIYSSITASVFGALTTVTVLNDAGTLDAGLSAVSYGLVRATNTSHPLIADTYPIVSGSSDKTKKLRLEVDGLTTATTRVLTVQDSDDTLVGRATTDTLTNKTITGTTNTVGAGVLGTEQAATSGTSIDFTSIPSWVKKIIIQFVGVSTSGTSTPIVQLGDAGGVENSGYLGTAALISNGASPQTANFTAGVGLSAAWSATTVIHGTVTLTLEDAANFTWVASVNLGMSDTAQSAIGAASKSTSAALDRVRITTSGGADTFDAGAVNILYE